MEADALGECEVRRQDKGGPRTTFLPLFTRHQPFHLHTGEKGPSPLKPWGSPCSFLCSPAVSLFPVGPGCLQSPQSPPECQVQGAPWSCVHVGTAGSLGSASCLPTGVGSAPQVRITGPEVRVVCTASGWPLSPRCRERDVSGEKFLAFSEAHTQDAEGLFSVEAGALVVRDSSVV